MTEYSRRATKLCSLLEALSTTPIGTIHDLAKLASLTYQFESPFEADFNVNRPIDLVMIFFSPMELLLDIPPELLSDTSMVKRNESVLSAAW